MSNEVPAPDFMSSKSSYPYCIWHPELASEDTYRKVAAAFPGMRYQVGRACAVAGYARLYRELDLLPDPCIAEEAREAGRVHDGSRQIFEDIMAAPVRYAVMNDYDLTIEMDKPKPGACLNADTAVISTLARHEKFYQNFVSWRYFNITEDWGIAAEENVELEPAKLNDEEAALLASPLPFDLPTMNKDLLILTAAYDGNVDRYARLRRPGRCVEYELHCLVPGVYRSTAMALWLGRNPDVVNVVGAWWDSGGASMLRRAIHARHVMNNETRRLLEANPPVPDDELPYWIWYPTIPSGSTLCKLAEARPAMRPQCARACIAGGYGDAYAKIMDLPDAEDAEYPLAADWDLSKEAESSPKRNFFISDLEQRRERQGGLKIRRSQESWKHCNPWREGDIGSSTLYGSLADGPSSVVHEGQDWGMWESLGPELGRVRLHLSSTKDERELANTNGGVLFLNQ
jgi:hypothetical protein